MQTITHKILNRKEILLHNTEDDCWVIIRNNVYDLTRFLNLHPGGKDIILSRAGEDATSFFVAKHGTSKAQLKALEQYIIGELPLEEQIKTDDFDEPFLMELIHKAYKAKLFTVSDSFQNSFFWLRMTNIVLFALLTIIVLYSNSPWWISFFLVILQALIGTSLFGLIAHEATHRNYPKNKLLKFLLDIIWPIFWPFISQYGLRYEHNSHHIKIGDPEYDFEVAAFSSFIRYSGMVTPNKLHKYQHHLAQYIYPFYANIITTIGGIRSNFWSRHNRKVALKHNLSLLITVSFYIVLPTLITNGSIYYFILMYLVYQCVLFYGIYIGSAINHFVPQVADKIPHEHINKYAYYICHNTTNFSLNNKFWFWYTGGFNIQIEHHLIPFVPVENLRRMTKIVKELCEKYNYPYKEFKTMSQLWKEHYNYLAIMANAEITEIIKTEINNKHSYEAR